MIARPKTQYAKSGDVSIAYQVVGDGPIDVLYVPGYISHVELVWEVAPAVHIIERLASFARVIMFDKRGSGLSDPVEGSITLEERMDDLRAVLDAVGSTSAAIVGVSEGGPIRTAPPLSSCTARWLARPGLPTTRGRRRRRTCSRPRWR
jgi:pimeloyl-ACP methyl ester carboxylesterase